MDGNFDKAYPDGRPAVLSQNTMTLSEASSGGGGLELQFGVRIAQNFTPFVFVGGYAMQAGDGLEDLGFAELDYERPGDAEGVQSTPQMLVGGLGLRMGTARGEIGGFGEAAFAFHSFSATQNISFFEATGLSDCELTRTYTGGAFRAAGGASVPVGDVFQLAPYAMFAVGKFTNAEVKAQCLLDGGYSYDPEADPHVIIGIGLGGEFVFGSDGPAE